jgi:hypothetical protein
LYSVMKYENVIRSLYKSKSNQSSAPHHPRSNTIIPMRVIVLVLRVTVFFIVTMVFLTGAELLVRHYRNRWYEKQQNYITQPVCEKIQPGMSSNEVWTLVEKAGEPHLAGQAPTILDFSTMNGACTAWLNPTSDNVVTREYHEPAQHFVLLQ